jgi:hypothetical protein
MMKKNRGQKFQIVFCPKGKGTKLPWGAISSGEKGTMFPRGLSSLREKRIMFPWEASSRMFESKLHGVKIYFYHWKALKK